MRARVVSNRWLVSAAVLIAVVGACAARYLGVAPPGLRVWGFTVPWDANSSATARTHATELDAVVSGWIQLDTITGQPFTEFRDTLARRTPPGMRLMAIVTNAVAGRFHPDAVRRLAADSAALSRAAADIARRASATNYRGLVIDLEGFLAADRDVVIRVSRTIADSAHARGVRPVVVAVNAVDTTTYPGRGLVPAADYLLVMLYDQHWTTSAPGPLAAPDWVRRATATRVAEVGADHVVAALPLYGYRWPTSGPAAALSFANAQRDAALAGVQLQRDTSTSTLHATSPGAWDMWVSDAGLLEALIHEVRAQGVGTIALWRLGQEDAAVWPLLARMR